jgi:hypothetical protein
MKLYDILKDFNGSQTGHDFQAFKAGTTANLSDSLAAIAVKEGWVKPIAVGGIVPMAKPVLVGETPSEQTVPADDRETKVTAPEESKPARPFHKKGK